MRLPRKIKKKLKQIPYTGFCYGGAIGDNGKKINGMRKFKHHICPFNHGCHCSILNNIAPKNSEDWDYQEHCIDDMTAICHFDSPIVNNFLKHLTYKNNKFLFSKKSLTEKERVFKNK